MLVSQLMSQNLITCGPRDSLQSAAGKMWDQDIGCLPVIDAEGRVVGIVTDRDACMAAYTQGRSLDQTFVDSAMAHEVFSCAPSDRIEEVEAVMKTRQIRRMPVTDEQGHLVGMISMNDLVRESARELGKKDAEVTAPAIVSTIASISEPRQSGTIQVAAE